jgi:hypothetical protein
MKTLWNLRRSYIKPLIIIRLNYYPLKNLLRRGYFLHFFVSLGHFRANKLYHLFAKTMITLIWMIIWLKAWLLFAWTTCSWATSPLTNIVTLTTMTSQARVSVGSPLRTCKIPSFYPIYIKPLISIRLKEGDTEDLNPNLRWERARMSLIKRRSIWVASFYPENWVCTYLLWMII